MQHDVPRAALVRAPAREPVIDAFKTVGCLAIILHHLAFYGPMSDLVRAAWPPLSALVVDCLFEYGRAAVYGFLVVGGYLSARTLAPDPAHPSVALARDGLGGAIILRYARLAPAAWVAIVAAVAAAWLARQWFDHEATPGPASVGQVVAHLLLLQDLLGIDGLSAGLWYVAVDLQLYALLAVLVHAIGPRDNGRRLVLATWLVAAGGWLVLARHDALDVSGLFFVGAYFLGVMAAWQPSPGDGADHPNHATIAATVLLAVCVAALLVAPRFRTVLAVGLTWLLVVRPRPAFLSRRLWRMGSDLSYAAFVIHYPVCLLVNAAVTRWGGTDPLVNLAGIALAVMLSYGAAAVLERMLAWADLPARLRRWRASRPGATPANAGGVAVRSRRADTSTPPV